MRLDSRCRKLEARSTNGGATDTCASYIHTSRVLQWLRALLVPRMCAVISSFGRCLQHLESGHCRQSSLNLNSTLWVNSHSYYILVIRIRYCRYLQKYSRSVFRRARSRSKVTAAGGWRSWSSRTLRALPYRLPWIYYGASVGSSCALFRAEAGAIVRRITYFPKVICYTFLSGLPISVADDCWDVLSATNVYE